MDDSAFSTRDLDDLRPSSPNHSRSPSPEPRLPHAPPASPANIPPPATPPAPPNSANSSSSNLARNQAPHPPAPPFIQLKLPTLRHAISLLTRNRMTALLLLMQDISTIHKSIIAEFTLQPQLLLSGARDYVLAGFLRLHESQCRMYQEIVLRRVYDNAHGPLPFCAMQYRSSIDSALPPTINRSSPHSVQSAPIPLLATANLDTGDISAMKTVR
jgi:hypothetical protein